MGIRKEIPLYDAEFIMTDKKDSPDNQAVLYEYDRETGQTSFDVIDHVRINSETPRIRQFQGESMGRHVVGLFSKKTHWGDMVVTTLRQSQKK
jgi:hypothetical protein